jgi:glutaredoxin
MYVMITRDQCSFCDDAKALLKGSGNSWTEYNIESQSSKWVLSLLKKSTINTVPQIFKPDGTHLGGLLELKEYLSDANS